MAFRERRRERQRAKKHDGDNGVSRDVVPSIHRGNIFRRSDPDQKKGAAKICEQRKQNGADDEQATLRDREPLQFAEEQPDHQ